MNFSTWIVTTDLRDSTYAKVFVTIITLFSMIPYVFVFFFVLLAKIADIMGRQVSLQVIVQLHIHYIYPTHLKPSIEVMTLLDMLILVRWVYGEL